MKKFDKTFSNRQKIYTSLKEMILNIKPKHYLSMAFFFLILFFYLFQNNPFISSKNLERNKAELATLNDKLSIPETQQDSIIAALENQQLLKQINDKLINYIFKVPDYSYVNVLTEYFKYSPELLTDIPSMVPLEKGNYFYTSGFGLRFHPIQKTQKNHTGVDLAAAKGTKVYSTASGTVIKTVKSNSGYGYYIIIKHRFGFQTLYGHLSKILVLEGQSIKQNQLIATVGSSGASTGNHLHYEIKKNSKKINPIPSFNLKKTVFKDLAVTK